MANEVTDITLEKITQDSPLIEVPKLDLEQITTQLLKAGDVDIPTSEIKLTGEEKIIVFTTPFFLDTFHNAASNIEGACKTLQNFHTHKDMLETREGVYSPNSALYEPSAADSKVVTALFRFYDKDGGNTEGTDKVFFARTYDTDDNVEGFIYWNGQTSAWVHLALPSGVTMSAAYVGDYKQRNNKTYYSDGNSPVMELGFVNGTLKALKAGLPSPDWKKDIDLCETATMGSAVGEWAVTYDPVNDTSNVAITGCGTVTLDDSYMKREEGDYSLQFRARFPTAGVPRPKIIFTKKITATTTFETFENGEVSNGNDYISFRLYRHVKSLIKGLTLQFSVGGTAFTKIWSFPICGDFRVMIQTVNITVDSEHLTDTTAGVDFTPYTTTPSTINPTIAKFFVRFLDVGGNFIGGAWLGDLHASTDHIIHIFQNPSLKTVGGLFIYGKVAGNVTGYEICANNEENPNIVATGIPGITTDWMTFSNAVSNYANNPYDHQSFDMRLRKRWALPEGTSPPSDPETEWDGIQAYRWIVVPDKETAGVTLTDPEVTACFNTDNLKLLKSPPIPIEMSVKIANFEGGEEWGTTGVNIEPNIGIQGMGCLRIKSGVTATWDWSGTKNWTYYGTPYLSSSDPELAVKGSAFVSFWAAGQGGGTKTITVKFYSNSGAVNVYHDYPYPYSTNTSANMIAAWNELSVMKGVGFAEASLDWSAVEKMQIINNTNNDLFVDKMRIIPYKGTKIVEDFNCSYTESAEASGSAEVQYIYLDGNRRIEAVPPGSVLYNTSDAKYMEEMGDNPTDKAIYKWGSILITTGEGDYASAIIDRCDGKVAATESLLDLTKYETVSGYSAAIEATDEFSCWVKMGETESGETKNSDSVGEITFFLYYSASVGSFDTADFWTYTFSAEYLKQAFKKSKQISLRWKLGDMVFGGTTAVNNNLALIGGGKITLKGASGKKAMVWFDSWKITKPGALTGTIYAKLKFLNNNQEESVSSEASIPVSCDSSNLYIIDMASPTLDTRITAKALYLIGGTSNEWRKVGIYPPSIDNIKVTIKEENFGEVMGPDYYEPPPKVEIIEPVNNQMLYFNVTGWDNRKYPSYLYWSRPSMPGQVSKLDFMPIDNEDGQLGMGIANFYNYTIAFKNYSTYVVDIESRSYVRKSEVYGLIAKRGLAVTPYGVAFLSHQGLILTDVSSFDDKWAEPINNIFTDAFETYGDRYLKIAICAYLDKFFYIFFDQTNAGANNKCLCCYMPDGAKGWKELVLRKQTDATPTYASIDVRSVAISGDPALSSTESRTIFIGDEVGRIYQMNRGDYDVCDTYTKIPIVGKRQTFDVDLGTPQNIKQILSMYHNSAKASTDNGSVTFTPYYNQQAGTATSVQSITSAYFGRSSKLPLKSGQGSLMGMYLETGTKTMAITAFADAGGGNTTVTVAAHGLLDTTPVSISGTTNYNGDYVVANAVTNTFTIIKTWVATETGTLSTYKGRVKFADMPVNYTDRGMV